jgi:MFS family permease
MTEDAETAGTMPASRAARQWQTVDRPILASVAFNFAAYLTIGLPLAVLPPFVHGPLGFSSVLAGFAVSAQYLATFLTRAPVGRMADMAGPKRMVILGLVGCLACGAFTALGGLCSSHHILSLALLLTGRLCLGAGESGVATGCLSWAIGRVGAAHSNKVISWNGIATYGGISLGAPLGVMVESLGGFWAIGLAMMAVPVIALPFAARGPVTRLVKGPQLSLGSVFGRILPHGAALSLSSIGFGVIAAFITLDYASRRWSHAALALTAFGIGFVLSRLLFISAIARQGGNRIAFYSFLAEALGLALLWGAGDPLTAMLGAGLAGFGFSLVFPALGVEVLARVPPANRGAALGAFTVFLDIALGVTGPIAGFLVGPFGYASIFFVGAIGSLSAAAIMIGLGIRRLGR